jgi:hypothetical protein
MLADWFLPENQASALGVACLSASLEILKNDRKNQNEQTSIFRLEEVQWSSEQKEKTMNKNTITLEEHLAFVKAVEAMAKTIYGAAGNNNAHKAALLAGDLVQFAMTQRHQQKMQQETAGGYDLATLKVDAAAPSNSETGWERLDDD